MIELKDQTGYTVRLHKRPDRIVSVVPSQTELLSDLGLDDQIAGITKFCIHPDHIFRTKSRIGGTKALNFEKIQALNPDLIIANKEENLKEEILQLREHFPVFTSDINNLEDSIEMIRLIGLITGKEIEANEIIQKTRTGFNDLEKELNKQETLSCLYMIWKKPWMAAGKGTFIDDMLHRCRLKNVLSEGRYPELDEKQIKELNPEVVLLSSEPYPFKEKHIEELRSILPCSKVIVADGEMFSWYGSRLLIAPGYLIKIRRGLIS